MRKDRNDIERVLISQKDIETRVCEMGQVLEKEYEGKNPLVLGILKGAAVFVSDLIRAVDVELEMDFLILSSYGNSDKPGKLVIKRDYEGDMRGRHVLVVDDITDSGQTLSTLQAMFEGRGAASVKTCVLLDKPSRRQLPYVPNYSGFQVGNEFVVGYGLDYAERFRNLPDICTLKNHVYAAE